jgi:hypothetical protein
MPWVSRETKAALEAAYRGLAYAQSHADRAESASQAREWMDDAAERVAMNLARMHGEAGGEPSRRRGRKAARHG